MHAQPRPFTLQLFLDFRTIFFPEWPLIFWVITIHQVIWKSPGTLDTPTIRESRSFVLTLFILKAPNYVLARTLTERVV